METHAAGSSLLSPTGDGDGYFARVGQWLKGELLSAGPRIAAIRRSGGGHK